MATPRPVSYRVASGGTIYGGRFAPGQTVNLVGANSSQSASSGVGALSIPGVVNLVGANSSQAAQSGTASIGAPAWYSAANASEWTTLPNSTLTASGIGWAGTHPGGTDNYEAVVNAWGGGILNTVGVHHGGAFVSGTFLVLFGGGHGNYGGNELYAYGPLEADSPIWRRLTNPTIPPPDDVARVGGYPVSRHTYDSLVYLPTLNKMLCIGAPSYHTGYALNSSDIFDFSVNPGVQNPWSPNDVGFPAYNGGGYGAINLLSGYNKQTGKAWGMGRGNAQELGSWDATTGTWTNYAKDNPFGANNTKAAIDRNNNLFVFINGSTVYVQNLAAPGSTIYSPSAVGSGPPTGDGSTIEYDEAGSRFVVWNTSGKTLYFLTPGANPLAGGDAWTWTTVTPGTGSIPANAVAQGTFGRFRMNNGVLRGVVLMPAQTQPIVFYKM
jgi:hypothetical protein